MRLTVLAFILLVTIAGGINVSTKSPKLSTSASGSNVSTDSPKLSTRASGSSASTDSATKGPGKDNKPYCFEGIDRNTATLDYVPLGFLGITTIAVLISAFVVGYLNGEERRYHLSKNIALEAFLSPEYLIGRSFHNHKEEADLADLESNKDRNDAGRAPVIESHGIESTADKRNQKSD